VLNQAQASLSLADVTARRYRQLIKLDAVSQQQVDQNEQNLLAQQANVKAASADVANLQQQQAYEKVVAPFDGIVTARHTDIGDLINAGNGGPGAELFRVSRTSTIRTFVSVPEEYSQQIRDGMHVSLELTELPGERFEGSVTRSAGAINVQSRTLLVEVDVLNASERLLPGAYAKVHIGLSQSSQSLLVPAGSILFQAAGTQIAVVDPAQHIELRKVSIGIDYGNAVEITSGITQDDPIVADPPDYVLAGMPVSVRRTVGQPQESGNGTVHSPK
jgi:RND family efflux transporter MFP subunit